MKILEILYVNVKSDTMLEIFGLNIPSIFIEVKCEDFFFF